MRVAILYYVYSRAEVDKNQNLLNHGLKKVENTFRSSAGESNYLFFEDEMSA